MQHNSKHTIVGMIEDWGRLQPEKEAILGLAREPMRYGELMLELERVAVRLAGVGIRRNDRVAVVLPNGPEMAVMFLGVSSCCACAPLNPGYSVDEFQFYLEDLKARVLVTGMGVSDAASAAATKLGIPVLRVGSDLRRGAGALAWEVGAGDAVDERGKVAAERAAADDVALVLHTSGTTSRPKQVPLTQANLAVSAGQIARSLELTAADRCLNIMPLFHVHGLVGALLSTLASGGSVVCTTGFDAGKFFEWLEGYRPTWYTGVPTMHQSILGKVAGGGRVRSELRLVRSCSAALPPKVMMDLEAAFGVPVIEAYGMTEAAHQMASNPLPPGVRKPGSVGRGTGTEIAILDDAGDEVASGAVGEVSIRGLNVTGGYEANEEANAKAFVRGWFRTGDQGYLDGEGYLFLTGRLKELINRGGEKISPREIDEAYLEHPGVAQAVAFGRRHPTLGEDVAMAVVLKAGSGVSEEELRAFGFERLAAFKVPSCFVFLEQIPKGPTGKVQRVGLAEKLAEHFKPRYEPPRDDLEAIILDIFQEVLEVGAAGMRDNFFLLGGDSIRATRVVARVNELFELQLAATVLFRHPTAAWLTGEVRRVAETGRVDLVLSTLREVRETAG